MCRRRACPEGRRRLSATKSALWTTAPAAPQAPPCGVAIPVIASGAAGATKQSPFDNLPSTVYLFNSMLLPGTKTKPLLLAGVFLLFNVGLPIVIDACPMPRPPSSMACPLCRESGRDGNGPVLKGKPCCAPQIAAERNISEFIGAQKAAHPAVVHLCTLVLPAVTISALPVAESSVAFSPPHHIPDDIPVAFSALLI